jgi:hypothetical protein
MFTFAFNHKSSIISGLAYTENWILLLVDYGFHSIFVFCQIKFGFLLISFAWRPPFTRGLIALGCGSVILEIVEVVDPPEMLEACRLRVWI